MVIYSKPKFPRISLGILLNLDRAPSDRPFTMLRSTRPQEDGVKDEKIDKIHAAKVG
jgi:hypothetical protein